METRLIGTTIVVHICETRTRPRQHGGYPFIYCLFPDFKLRPVASIHRATTSMDQIRMQIPRTSTMSVLVKQPLLALVSGSKHVLWCLFEVWLVVVQYLIKGTIIMPPQRNLPPQTKHFIFIPPQIFIFQNKVPPKTRGELKPCYCCVPCSSEMYRYI